MGIRGESVSDDRFHLSFDGVSAAIPKQEKDNKVNIATGDTIADQIEQIAEWLAGDSGVPFEAIVLELTAWLKALGITRSFNTREEIHEVY